ncbi:MAG: pilus assembly protein TadG-related protein [Alphaproteobacteria bacterium]
MIGRSNLGGILRVRDPRTLAADTRGATAAIWGLVLPVLIGSIGIGVESGMWYVARADLQAAADAGALGGALELSQSSTGTVSSEALAEAVRNGFVEASGSYEVNRPPVHSTTHAGDNNAVEVRLTKNLDRLFSGIFSDSTITVSANSVAKVTPSDGDACILALDTSASGAISLSGGAEVEMEHCAVASNSSSSSSISAVGGSELEADQVFVYGNVSTSGGSSVEPSPATTGVTISDPYASLTAPTVPSTCDQTNYSTPSNGSTTLSPGKYCGNTKFKNNVTLNSGVYYIDGGSLSINSGATVTGSGVTIYLSGSSTVSTISINGGATVTLSAPTNGSYSGMLFWQSSSASTTGTNTFNGGSSLNLTGALYFPNQQLTFNGGNNTSGSQCTKIVARIIKFSGGSEFENEGCEAAGVADITTASTVALVE